MRPKFTPAAPSVDLLQRLQCFPYLEGLSASAVELFQGRLRAVDIPRNTYLLREGSSCDGLLLLEMGEIRVFRQSESGREITLYRVEPGESCVLGTSCVLGHQNYPAQAMTTAATRALMIPAELFRRLHSQEAVVQRFVTDLLSRRLADLMTLVTEVSFGKMDQRLAAFLLREAEGPGSGYHPVQLSHEQIAGHLGTAREVISRLLQQYADQGMITLERRMIKIEASAALKKMASI